MRCYLIYGGLFTKKVEISKYTFKRKDDRVNIVGRTVEFALTGLSTILDYAMFVQSTSGRGIDKRDWALRSKKFPK